MIIETDLKIAFKVKFCKDNKVDFTLLHIHPQVHMWTYPIFFVNDDTGYVFEKTNHTKYNRFRFMIPFTVLENRNLNTCSYTFETERDKYDCLNTLRKNLQLFSKSFLFKKVNEKPLRDKYKILYYNQNWLVY